MLPQGNYSRIPRNAFTAAMARRELQRREEEIARARQVESSVSDQEEMRRVREATGSTAIWARNYTKTFNPHWFEEGRSQPYEPFPEHWRYFDRMFEMMDRAKVSAIEKSRDLMASWAVVAYFTRQAMMVNHRQVVFQSIGDEEAEQLVEYSYHLYDSQPDFLRRAFPLASGRRSKDSIKWQNGSEIWSVASGKDKIRSYHPWGYFQDESGFQPEGLQCLDAALGTGAQKVVLASSANIGWWADWRNDNIEL